MGGSAKVMPLLAVCLFSLACSRELPDSGGGKEAPAHREIVIVIELPGDDFASGADLDVRDALAAAIAEGGHGEITRKASGMGFMEIAVRLERAEGINAIKTILREIYPDARYRIER